MFYAPLFAAELRRQERLVHRNKLKQDPALAAQLAESRLQPVTYREASPTLAPAIQVCLAGISIISCGFCDKAWSWFLIQTCAHVHAFCDAQAGLSDMQAVCLRPL